MIDLQLEILKFLRPKGLGENQDISPLLLKFFPGISDTDEDRVKEKSGIIIRILKNMQDLDFINYYHTSPLGGPGPNNNFNWISNTSVTVTLKLAGITALDANDAKEIERELRRSMIATNKSIVEFNEISKKILKQQFYLTFASLGIAGVSAIFVIVTAYYSSKGVTDSTLNETNKQLKQQVQILERMLILHQKADSTIINIIRDSSTRQRRIK
jgi:hypothetical protein